MDFNGIDLATKLTSTGVGVNIPFTEQRLEVRKLYQRATDIAMVETIRSSPRRDTRRNYASNRSSQSSVNNNIIANQDKRLIQEHIGNNVQQRLQIRPDISQTDSAPSAANQKPAFIANELQMGPYHVVFCSYVEDGPNLFSVRLKSQEHILERMVNDLANVPRNQLATKHVIGLACIARYSEDNMLYRAVIQSVQANGCRVTFIDYGNSEFVSFSEIFEIPSKFLEHKAFSLPFQLAGRKKLHPIDKGLKDFFKDLISEAELELRVVPSDNPQLQQCELYIKAQSVLDMLKEHQTACNSYPTAPNLNDGDEVVIRYAKTAKQFYVARTKDIDNFEKMRDQLDVYGKTAPELKSLPTVGKCCAVLFQEEFYRVIVREQIKPKSVRVQMVDFGFEIVVQLNQLREIDSTFLQMPIQAIECCLVDFENVADVSETTGKQLEMIADDDRGQRTKFRVCVRHRLPNLVHVIDLRDDKKDVNVSLSVYKLAMPRKPFNNKRESKESNSTDKSSNSQTSTETTAKRLTNERNSRQNTYQGDGAESPQKFTDPINDRQSANAKSNSDVDREKPTKSLNNNNNNKWQSKSPGNR